MRDIIWTIILVWLVWRILDAFKGISKMQTQRSNHQQTNYNNQSYQQAPNNHRREGEVRVDSSEPAHKPHFKPGDGEYVDYEEIKP